MNTTVTGTCAEQLAREYLESHGLVTLTTNYSCRYGELDIVMQDNDTIVFVEVRFRKKRRADASRSSDYGGGILSVNHRKQQKLIRSSMHYLQCHHLLTQKARIDIVALSELSPEPTSFQWVTNAIQGYR